MYKYSAFGRIVKYIGMFHLWNIMEQFVPFLLKIKQISASESASQTRGRPILSDSRILFVYTDKSSELCVVLKIMTTWKFL